MTKRIFNVNAIILFSYTLVLGGLAQLFEKNSRAGFMIFVFGFVSVIHFMIVGILMAIYHFQGKDDYRNAYFKVFSLIWVVILLVMALSFL